MTDENGREMITTKNVEQMQADSIQARARDPGRGRMPLFLMLARAGQTIPPWWSKERDREMDRFWKNSDHLSGAFYTLSSKLSAVPFRVEPRDPNVAAHRRLAEEYQDLIEAGSEFGQGWQELVVPFLIDFYTQDNGGFLEVIGGGSKDGPIRGLPVGLAHLDSYRCHRTGSIEYPVMYEDYDGKLYRLHRTRVLYRSQMPSPRAEMYKVGFCWLSRCINAAQNLVDDLTYKQEKMGSRPKRAMMVTGGGLDPEDLASAFQQTDVMMDSAGLSRYSKFVIVGANYMPDARLDIIDLASLPDGFDYETDVTLAMYTIALAGAVPPRWLWPATVSGATKADAMYQHVAGLTGGPGATLQMLAGMLGGPERGAGAMPGVVRFLPASLRLVFDFQDDEQDRTAAEIANVRSQARERDISTGTVSVRVAREIMVEDGELTAEQFEEMELEDGRLEDGQDVLALFQSADPQVMALLPVDPAAATDEDIQARIEENWAIALNSSNARQKANARRAIAALEKLARERRAEPLAEVAQEGPVAAEPAGELEDGEEEAPPVEAPAPAVKELMPTINVHMPQAPAPVVNAYITPPAVHVSPRFDVPRQPIKFEPRINVTVPKQAPPIINVEPNINVLAAKQAPPVVKVEPHFDVAAPVVNVEPRIELPEQPINFNPTINVPMAEEETMSVERDAQGLISKILKRRRIKHG